SKMSGRDFVKELLKGHPETFRDSMGMNKHVFRKLLKELRTRASLKDTKHL
ncbi:hypothetical protein SCHPADRAFT_801938, partial [Schizopora paradoxa]